MKKIQLIVISSFLSLITITISAQIGIYTETPLALFHIDTNKDNDSGSGSETDDVVFTHDGKMGIGTANPSAKLDIRGTLKYDTGNQRAGMVLVSDADGNASWGVEPYLETVESNEDADAVLPYYRAGSSFRYMGVSITLKPGSWKINFNATYHNSSSKSLTIWWDLSTSSTIDDRVDRVLSASGVPGTYCPVAGIYFVEHMVTTTYYVWSATNWELGSTTVAYSGEGRLWATPLNTDGF